MKINLQLFLRKFQLNFVPQRYLEAKKRSIPIPCASINVNIVSRPLNLTALKRNDEFSHFPRELKRISS